MPVEGTARRRLFSFFVVAAAALAGACTMILEVAGAHALAPGFGTGLNAWSAMITVALGGLAGGYALGGLAADRWGAHSAGWLLPGVLAAGGLAFAADALTWHRVVYALAGFGPRTGALLAAGSLFGVPFVTLGAVYPLAVKLRTRSVDEVGRRSGLLSAISAVGSVVGAAGAGFALVPHLALETVLGLSAAALLAVAAGLLAAAPSRRGWLAGLLLLPVGVCAAFAPPRPLGEGVLCRRASLFGPVEVIDSGDIRYLMVSGSNQGMASRHDYRPMFPYVSVISETLKENVALDDTVLLVGLGAGLLPRALPPGACESVEVDPVVVEMAERFFGFEAARYPVHTADGRAFLLASRRRYGAVVIDAYAGWNYPYHLLTRECLELVRERLLSDGLLIVNFQGYLRGPEDRLLRAVEKTLRAVFAEVHMCAWTEHGDYGNVVMVACRRDGGPQSPTGAIRSPIGFRWPTSLRDYYEAVSTFLDERPAGVLTDSRNPVSLWGAAAERLRRARSWPGR